MCLGIRLLQSGSAHVRVYLRRDQTLVPEHFLNTANVCPAIEQMGCETVTKRVRCCPRIQAALLDVLFQHARDTASR